MRLKCYRALPFVLSMALTGWALLLATTDVVAQNGTQVPEFLGLEDFPEARVMMREYRPDQTYVLALSTFKKVGGTWSAEREQRVQGNVLRRTLELPSGFSAREGFRFYEEQLISGRARELFACEERECGGSINWANNHFNVIQLYGLDQFQYYSVYEVVRDDTVYYASLYSVRRGNRRVYVQLDLVQMPEVDRPALTLSPAVLGERLREAGYFVLPGFDVVGSAQDWRVSVSESAIDALATLLRQESGWVVALVGHDYGADSLEAQQSQSLHYAEQVREKLKAQGVSEQRIPVFGLGSLSPAGKGERSARVEVVRLPER
ncbi:MULTISPECIES: DUF4892 domain-containing protein [unclassified Marinimicrobium]|jgi:hypothetical protein|uniref:DUF4892 domain-containing protein n=1 Tax=unclassified Marinimicrobium TaxID=2632100 RepID=UPI00257BDB88|nr:MULTISPECIES: DUF4892 domain-containing protein [unclassified Marinimicrobium]